MNNEIKSLFNLTKFNYVQTNTIITSNNGNPKAILTRQSENNVVEHLSTLKEQNTTMKHIKMQVSTPKLITMWHNICSQMPKNIFIFVRRALIFSLPNNSNLCRWGRKKSASCIMCTSNKQTNTTPYAI